MGPDDTSRLWRTCSEIPLHLLRWNTNNRNIPFNHKDDLTRRAKPASADGWLIQLGNIFSSKIYLQTEIVLSCDADSLSLCALSQVHVEGLDVEARKEGNDDSDLCRFDYLVSCSMMTCHWLQDCSTRCSSVTRLMQLNFLLRAKHSEDQQLGQNK